MRRGTPEQREAAWAAFVSGYRERRPLAALDEEAVPVFAAAAMISGIGISVHRATFSGHEEFSDPNLDERLQMVQDWARRHGLTV